MALKYDGLERIKSLGYIEIGSLSDFPAPVGGVITLAKDQAYFIKNPINIGNNRITIPPNSSTPICFPIIFQGIAMITYEGTDSMFFDDGDGRFWLFENPGFSAPNGSIFDCGDVAGSAGNSIIIRLGIALGSVSVGEIRNYDFYTFDSFAMVANQSGIILNSLNNVLGQYLQWTGGTNIAGHGVTFRGDFKTISIVGGNTESNSSESVFLIEQSSTVVAGSVGNMTYLKNGGEFFDSSGKDSSDPSWRFSGCSGIRNSNSIGTMNMEGNITNTNITALTPTNFTGTTFAGTLERFTHTTSPNRLTYIGEEPIIVRVSAHITIKSTVKQNNTYFLYIYKNGLKIPNISSSRLLSEITDKGSLSLATNINLDKNDYIEIYIENKVNSTAVLIESIQVVI